MSDTFPGHKSELHRQTDHPAVLSANYIRKCSFNVFHILAPNVTFNFKVTLSRKLNNFNEPIFNYLSAVAMQVCGLSSRLETAADDDDESPVKSDCSLQFTLKSLRSAVQKASFSTLSLSRSLHRSLTLL